MNPIDKSARECGATTYTNRHTPGETAIAFGPQAWAKFCEAVAAQQPQASDAEDAACWRWLSEHIEVAWSENGFTSLVRIVSDKHRDMLTATVKRMMAGDWSDTQRHATQPQAETHLFELWWADHMPEAQQTQAWAAWIAAQRAYDVDAAPDPAEAAPQWLPIETAPRDGTKVLAYWFGNDIPFISVIRWTKGKNLVFPWRCAHTGSAIGGFGDDHLPEAKRTMKQGPTHWMPLPPAPGILSDGGAR